MIRQAVMPAKVAWKAANTNSGMTTPLLKVAAFEKVPATLSQMPFMKRRSVPPMKALPLGEREAVAIQHPQHDDQRKPTITCISTDSMFLLRTRPP